MAFSLVGNVALRALSAVVPAQCVRITDELAWFNDSRAEAERFSAISGLRERRIAPEGVTVLDLAESTANTLLREEEALRQPIDAVLFITHSADYPLPSNASLLQHRLGLSRTCLAMDLNVGCAAFVHGLWIAAGLVASGGRDRVLLVTGDTPGRFTDRDNRVLAPVFGDSTCAALIERDAEAAPMSFLTWNDGNKYEALVIPGGGSRIPYNKDDGPDSPFNRIVRDGKGTPWRTGGYCSLWMDGMMIYAFGVSTVPAHINEHLAREGAGPGDMDGLFLHQANKIMLDAIAKKTGFPPEKAPRDVLGRYGNLGGTSIPVLLCEHYGNEADKPRSRVILCGFGAGLALSSCVLSLEKTRIHPVRDFDVPEDQESREHCIQKQHAAFADGD